MVSRRRLIAAVGGLTSIVAGVVSAQAAPVTVHPSSVRVSQGDVTILRTSVSDGQELDYQVTFSGPFAVHGWTYTGTLQGTAVATSWETFYGDIPAFDVTSPDGVVTGACGGSPDNPADDATGLGVSEATNGHGYTFGCDLWHDGVPWQVSIKTHSQQAQVDTDTTRFSGTYRLVDAETSLVGIEKNVTYGDVQLSSYTDDGGGVQFGPLHFSGQIVIGSTRYVGDLVSAVGPYIYSLPMPDMQVTGSSNGQQVTGACGGTVDPVFSEVEWTYDFTCRLSVNGGPEVSVPLRATFTGGGGRCRGRQCWSDQRGYYLSE
jgi:hypothetical protein